MISIPEWFKRARLLSDRAAMPDAIVHEAEGEVVLYWQRPGLLVEATIVRTDRVEWMVWHGDSVQHFESDADFAVVIEDGDESDGPHFILHAADALARRIHG